VLLKKMANLKVQDGLINNFTVNNGVLQPADARLTGRPCNGHNGDWLPHRE